MSKEDVEIKQTNNWVALVIEALADQCDNMKDAWQLDKRGWELTEKMVAALTAAQASAEPIGFHK